MAGLSMSRPGRVLIADDHPVVRDGLRGMFEDRVVALERGVLTL